MAKEEVTIEKTLESILRLVQRIDGNMNRMMERMYGKRSGVPWAIRHTSRDICHVIHAAVRRGPSFP